MLARRIKRFRLGTFSPTLIAAALVVAVTLMAIGAPADQRDPRELLAGDLVAFDWSEQVIQQDGLPPDILASTRVDQTNAFVFYDDMGEIDTSQTGAAIEMTKTETGWYMYDGAIDHGTGKTMLTTATAFYDSGGSGIDDGSRGSPGTQQAITIAKAPGHGTQILLEPDTPTAAPTS